MAEIVFYILTICLMVFYSWKIGNKKGWRSGYITGLKNGIIEANDEVNKLIKYGQLSGDGSDKTAERNGLILASNVITKLEVK